jgi:hypothetical protein
MPGWGAYSWATRATEYEHGHAKATLKRGDDEPRRTGVLGVLYDARQFADEQILT